jgi:hypothetical protein
VKKNVILLAISAAVSCSSSLSAQCTLGLTKPYPRFAPTSPPVPNAYPKYSIVNFYYPSTVCGFSSCYPNMFTSAGVNAMYTAMAGWQASSSTNNSFISFQQWMQSTPPDNSSSAANVRGYYIPELLFVQIANSDMPNPDWVAFATAGLGYYAIPPTPASSSNLRIMSASITIRQSANLSDLVSVGAHELGHLFSLDDCPSCFGFSTVMYSAPSSLTPASPTSCDNEQVRQTAYP